MQLVHSLSLPPGHCFICRVGTRESYVDTGISLDYEGAFYICNLCLGEAARIMHFISHDEFKDLRAAKEELEHLNYELTKRVGALEESLRALADAGYNYKPNVGVVVDGGFSIEELQRAADHLEQESGDFAESFDDSHLAGVQSSGDDDDAFSIDI